MIVPTPKAIVLSRLLTGEGFRAGANSRDLSRHSHLRCILSLLAEVLDALTRGRADSNTNGPARLHHSPAGGRGKQHELSDNGRRSALPAFSEPSDYVSGVQTPKRRSVKRERIVLNLDRCRKFVELLERRVM